MSLSFTFALREIRSGIKGFRIFLACLALGVAALAGAGSIADAFRHGLATQAQSILGGDIAVSVEGRRFSAQEQAAFLRLGQVSDRLHVRAMASAQATDTDRRLVEMSGVDASYPLAGSVGLKGAPSLRQAIRYDDGLPGAAVAPELLMRFHMRLGDTLVIGNVPFRIRAVISREPDTLAHGFMLGPRVIVSKSVLLSSGILQTDALFGETFTIALRDRSADATAKALAGLKSGFPDSGFTAKGYGDALSGLGRLIDQLDFFLSFIGLASLLTGGLGIGSAISAYLGNRRPSIAVLKALGADSTLIRNVYMIQLGGLTALGVVAGIVLGAAAPFVLGAIAGDRLPIPMLFAIYPWPLAKAAAFGVMAAAFFSLIPLAQARMTPPASLFRKDLSRRVGVSVEVVAMVVAGGGLAALSAITAPSPVIAGFMLLGLSAGFALLWGIGRLIGKLAAALRRVCRGAVRIGLSNLSGPRSAARTASPSMGFGIALLTTIILIQSSLMGQVTRAAGTTAPSLIFTQIAPEDGKSFDQVVGTGMGGLTPDRYRRYPFATGRITAINGVDVGALKIAQNVKWAFDQDVTLSALDAAPPEKQLTRGAWWPPGYDGTPRVVLDDQIADGAHIRIGELITVSLLGRDLDVTVAGTRKIDFGRFGANFPIILNASALDGANLREIAIARTTRAQEQSIMTAVGRAYPSVDIVSVREQLDAAADILAQIGWAIRSAGAVAAVASVLVLVGAMSANAQARAREAAIFKVLGSTRAFVIATYGVEYGAVGLIAGITGIGLGLGAAYPIIRFGLHAPFVFDWIAVLTALLIVVVLGAGLGMIAALATLSRRPISALREG